MRQGLKPGYCAPHLHYLDLCAFIVVHCNNSEPAGISLADQGGQNMRIKMIVDGILAIPGGLGSLSEVQVCLLGWLRKQRIPLLMEPNRSNPH